MVKSSLEKYPEDSDAGQYVECGICGYRSSDLASHPRIHGLSQDEYRLKYGAIKSKAVCESISGIKNPGYQHGGKLSPFSKKFVNFKSDEAIEDLKKSCVEKKKVNNTNVLSTTYYTAKGFSEDEAIQLLKDRQTTFSLDICIEKHGDVKGREIWAKRQQKWSKSFTKQNFSKISQELFGMIMKTYSGDIYYATLDRLEMDKYDNKEYRLLLNNGRTVLPDFIDLNSKKIIEFDGDYWHSEKVANPTKESVRDNNIEASGYTILHVKEFEFKKDKLKVLNECINFLTQ